LSPPRFLLCFFCYQKLKCALFSHSTI
jgi:hypothetical protein